VFTAKELASYSGYLSFMNRRYKFITNLRNQRKLMGAKSSAEYGNIFVKTDKTSYLTGETVTGMVHLNLHKLYPGNSCYFRFFAEEEVHWSETHSTTDSDGNSHSCTKYYDACNNIYDLTKKIYQWPNDALPPG